MRKNTKIQEFKNRRMNDDTYALRRQVMSYLYEARALIGRDNWQRVDVRIADGRGDHNYVGMARLNDFIIWIDGKYMQEKPQYLRELVYHELVHAITGFCHDENCDLMSSALGSKPLSKAKADKLLMKYFTA